MPGRTGPSFITGRKRARAGGCDALETVMTSLSNIVLNDACPLHFDWFLSFLSWSHPFSSFVRHTLSVCNHQPAVPPLLLHVASILSAHNTTLQHQHLLSKGRDHRIGKLTVRQRQTALRGSVKQGQVCATCNSGAQCTNSVRNLGSHVFYRNVLCR